MNGSQTSGSCVQNVSLAGTANLQPGCAHFAHMYEEYGKFAPRRRVLCTRVREIRRIRNREARTLNTCSRNTTNLLPGGAYFAHVFEKYDESAAIRRVLCTRVREIRRIYSRAVRTLHTWPRNTTNSQPGDGYFAHVFEKYDESATIRRVLCTRVREIQRICSRVARTLHTCSGNTTNSKPGCAYLTHMFWK